MKFRSAVVDARRKLSINLFAMWPFSKKENPQHLALRPHFTEAEARMRDDQVLGTKDGLKHVIGVRIIAENEKGQMALIVAHGYRAKAIHQIIKNGSFSDQGPKWTKKPWHHRSRRFAIVEAVLDLRPGGVGSVNSQVRTYGIRIVEMDTKNLPRMTFEDWLEVYYPRL